LKNQIEFRGDNGFQHSGCVGYRNQSKSLLREPLNKTEKMNEVSVVGAICLEKTK